MTSFGADALRQNLKKTEPQKDRTSGGIRKQFPADEHTAHL